MGDQHLGSNHFKGNDFFSSNHLAGGQDLCPNQYFGSQHFSSRHFASYHFASVCIPTPTPTPPIASVVGGGGTMGAGGGSPTLHEQGMTQVFIDQYPQQELELEDTGVSNEVVQKGMIQALRKKIAALEAFIQNLHQTHAMGLSAVSGELAQAHLLVDRLQNSLLTLENRSIHAKVREAVLAKFLPRLSGSPVERASGADVLVSLAALVAVEVFVPNEWTAVKGVARLATAGAAFRAVSSWIEA